MIVINSDMTVFCDVDDTLVKWSPSQEDMEQNGIMFNNYGHEIHLVPHKTHIEQLKLHKARGHKIIVWSAGGYQWAESVVTTLGLRDIVDLVIAKPRWVYDDLPASSFIPETIRVYKNDGHARKTPVPINDVDTIDQLEEDYLP